MRDLTSAELVRLLRANGFEPERDGKWRTVEAVQDWLASGRTLLAAGSQVEEKLDFLVPKAWLNGSPSRVITHWTAGGYRCSEVDKAHYHIIIDGEGRLHRGDYAIKANDSTKDGDGYAAHTAGANTKAIGVAVTGMANAVEYPFKPGPYPWRKEQWDVLVRVVAELCYHYNLKVTPTTVLGHGEVQKILGVKQAGKWDPMVLPWEPGLSKDAVGGRFRQEVQQTLDRLIQQKVTI